MSAIQKVRTGIAVIKPEFLVAKEEIKSPGNEIQPLESETPRNGNDASQNGNEASIEPMKEEKAEEEIVPPPNKKKFKGQNKARPRTVPKVASELRICPTIHRNETCRFGDSCRFLHNIEEYMKNKPPDLGEECVNFNLTGRCRFGVECRFASGHLNEKFENIIDKEKFESFKDSSVNVLSKALMNTLRKKKYKFERTQKYLKKMNIVDSRKSDKRPLDATSENDAEVRTCGVVTDEDVCKLRSCEKKKVDFTNKIYLAPLTTVGNLPFRRVCKILGVDITCGEMAMSTNILQGGQGEWALLKRHSSEDVFGVQLCGGYPDSFCKTVELINNECDVDFIDVNMGCPIDLVFKKGEGSALMGRLNKLEKIIKGMVDVSDVPITIKMRTGIYENKNTAHKVVPLLKEWGVDLMTLHGRTREQRYTKAADWDYINECAQLSHPIPFYGNGDILSYEDANLHRKQTKVNGLMIARGALIKPWVFTEIKEQRHWDISAQERFDILKDYTNYGLEHWGSDHKGVENTRRFMLEWLSFLHRYIPVGLLEHPPQRINERPPFYVGRNDLETMLASRKAADWVKISEMLLGPVPDGFNFIPKHKANSYT